MVHIDVDISICCMFFGTFFYIGPLFVKMNFEYSLCRILPYVSNVSCVSLCVSKAKASGYLLMSKECM